MKKIMILILSVMMFACTNPNDLENGIDRVTSKSGDLDMPNSDNIEEYDGSISIQGLRKRDIIDYITKNEVHDVIDKRYASANLWDKENLDTIKLEFDPSLDSSLKGAVPKLVAIGETTINGEKLELNAATSRSKLSSDDNPDFKIYFDGVNHISVKENEFFGNAEADISIFKPLTDINLKFGDTLSKQNDITASWEMDNPSQKIHCSILNIDFGSYTIMS